MDLELPHDILCRRAAHDNRRSRRSRWHHLQSTSCFIIESFWQLSARRRGILVCFVFFVVSKKLVFIRVHSWFSLHLLSAFSFWLSAPRSG
jgi:hypothetical protein